MLMCALRNVSDSVYISYIYEIYKNLQQQKQDTADRKQPIRPDNAVTCLLI